MGLPACEWEGFLLSGILPLINSSCFSFGSLRVLFVEGECLGLCESNVSHWGTQLSPLFRGWVEKKGVLLGLLLFRACTSMLLSSVYALYKASSCAVCMSLTSGNTHSFMLPVPAYLDLFYSSSSKTVLYVIIWKNLGGKKGILRDVKLFVQRLYLWVYCKSIMFSVNNGRICCFLQFACR